MRRGVIFLNNLELTALHSLVIEECKVAQNCVKKSLVEKLTPLSLGSLDGVDTNLDTNADNVEDNKLRLVQIQITEDDAETLLDCMPISNEQLDKNLDKQTTSLISARAKIQEFLFH